jgi:hypothetical protein
MLGQRRSADVGGRFTRTAQARRVSGLSQHRLLRTALR